MRRTLRAALLVVLALAPTSLLAQNVLPRPMVSGDTLYLTGVSQAKAASWGPVYVGPYDGQITDARFTSGDPTRPQLSLYCVDYAHDVSVGDSWQVNVTSLGGMPDMSNTYLGAGSLGRYQEAAFLASLFDSWGTYVNNSFVTYDYSGAQEFTSQAQVYSGIDAAIWTIMTGGFPTAFSGINATLASAMASAFVNLADAAKSLDYPSNLVPAGFAFDQWSVLSDVKGNVTGAGQEYLVRTTTVTPEPETYVLLLSGLVLLFGVARLRRRQSVAVV